MNVGTDRTFKTKKALKEAVAVAPVGCFGTSMFGPLTDGEHVAVGPDVYTKRTWYARVKVQDGRIVKVVG